jgi:hypothetical protein
MPVFRHKFSEPLLEMMREFASIHRYDDRETFKANFQEWKQDYKHLIEEELHRLQGQGYQDDIHEKIFRSVRYYFRKQCIKGSNPNSVNHTSHDTPGSPEKKTYTKMPKSLLQNIDEYISTRLDKKPSELYCEYVDQWERHEGDTLLSCTNVDETRLKKTFKNRHYRLISQCKTKEMSTEN